MNKFVKLILAAAILIMPAVAWAQGGNYYLKGKVGHFSAPAKAYLTYYESGASHTDSVLMTDGLFDFHGRTSQPVLAYLMINSRGIGIDTDEGLSQTTLFLEPGEIMVTGPDSLETALVKSGQLNTDEGTLKVELKPFKQRLKEMDKAYQSATENQKKSQAFTDDYEKHYTAVWNEIKQVQIAFIKANPNSLRSLFLVKTVGGSIPDAAVVEPLFNSLSPSLRSGEMGRLYQAEIARIKKFSVGAIAPDFTQTDTLGKAISLHDFRGKYVLVDFWASWCGPCRAENPNVVKAFDLYKGKGFAVLGVSLDEANGKKKWLAAIHDDHLHWTQVSDLKGWKNEVAQLYLVRAVPQNYLIGPDGVIIAKDLRGDALNSKLREIFDK